MPATFAHMCMVRFASKQCRMSSLAAAAIGFNPEYVELGSIGPDYPYLSAGLPGGEDHKRWADKMHYERTGDIIRAGINFLQQMPDKTPDGNFGKQLAWLMGYAAHVIGDVTIHPVVEGIVGPYNGNETAHRICELNQDAFIFSKLNLGEICEVEFVDSGIKRCQDFNNTVIPLWEYMVQQTHPLEYSNKPPQFGEWHREYCFLIDHFAEESNRLMILARFLRGYVFPKSSDVESRYIIDLPTPTGIMNYQAIFDFAVKNVSDVWETIDRGVMKNDNAFESTIKNWNLDTGKVNEQYEFWR